MNLKDFCAMPEGELFSSCSGICGEKFGKRVKLCAIINIRNGKCGMDCKFCAQSGYYKSVGNAYPLLSNKELLARIVRLEQFPISNIGLVASGARLSGAEFERLVNFLKDLPEEKKARLCVSLGRLDRENLRRLKDAGIRHYHHNLETSQKYYKYICTSQSWESRRDTARMALDLGFELCCGGLFGLGESWEDRLSLAESLADLGVKNIPVNFLIPQKGTPLEGRDLMSPGQALRILAMFRLLLPDATLRVCGGRKQILGKRQYEIFSAGANALMTGDYLTSPGEHISKDLEALYARNFKPG